MKNKFLDAGVWSFPTGKASHAYIIITVGEVRVQT